MAKSLNKDRMIWSKIAFAGVVLLVLFTRETFVDDTAAHEIFDLVGVILVAICALGRVYTTAFLGGHKNTNLIDQGPFSVVRNPLYVFSLIGVTGIALMSNQLVVMVGLPILFYLMYTRLVSREEGFLRETFGPQYEDYCRRVPRFLPRLSQFTAPDTIQTSPRQLWHAFRDAITWFMPYVLFEVVEYFRYEVFGG